MRKLVSVFVVCAFSAAPLLAEPTVGQTFYWQDKGGNISDYQLTVVAQVTLTQISGSSNGGAFLVTVNQGTLPLGGGFTTFCIEDEITFSPGTKYWVSVDSKAYSGNSGYGLAGDPISNVTEYIYDSWRSGNPNNWSQAAISQAIWYAEDEVAYSSLSNAAKAVYNAAVTAIGGTGNIGNAGHTWALNLWSGWKTVDGKLIAKDVQSHLITVPVPGAVLLGFLGLGYAGMKLRKRV
ncbi:MAG TPA: hypothetical protein PKZ07_06855 [Sedimentisphaerales bacterium]|nr:hypothetical protein [Sedimentisphaerales bacterium]